MLLLILQESFEELARPVVTNLNRQGDVCVVILHRLQFTSEVVLELLLNIRADLDRAQL